MLKELPLTNKTYKLKVLPLKKYIFSLNGQTKAASILEGIPLNPADISYNDKLYMAVCFWYLSQVVLSCHRLSCPVLSASFPSYFSGQFPLRGHLLRRFSALSIVNPLLGSMS